MTCLLCGINLILFNFHVLSFLTEGQVVPLFINY
jgi:hypothetical protein